MYRSIKHVSLLSLGIQPIYNLLSFDIQPISKPALYHYSRFAAHLLTRMNNFVMVMCYGKLIHICMISLDLETLIVELIYYQIVTLLYCIVIFHPITK